MKILAHRGYWNESIERNSPIALRTALEKGYGFESDVRDYMEKMVISHNIADASCQDAEEVFKWLHEYNDDYCFAINIKADGLKDILKDYFSKYSITNYFLFDMSVPQMVEFREMELRYFTRQSEVEPKPCMYEDAAGVWIDGFWSTDWITKELLEKHIQNGKEVCLVSPDLHGRKEYKDFWKGLLNSGIDLGKIILCTDHPDEAREYFYEQQD
jgi:hypothetical protein